MSRRPPPRTPPRPPTNPGDDLQEIRARAFDESGHPDAQTSPGVNEGPAQAQSQAPRAIPVARSREEFIDMLGDLRRQGSLDHSDEAALLREYDGLVVELRAEKARLEVEFGDRMARDGEDATQAWLAQAAEALGRRQGERMRQLIATIPAFSSQLAPG